MSKKKQSKPPLQVTVEMVPVETMPPVPVESLPPAPAPSPPVIVTHPWTGDGVHVNGLRCPKCHCIVFSEGRNVRNTLRVEGAIRRYRVCRKCGRTWTTIER